MNLSRLTQKIIFVSLFFSAHVFAIPSLSVSGGLHFSDYSLGQLQVEHEKILLSTHYDSYKDRIGIKKSQMTVGWYLGAATKFSLFPTIKLSIGANLSRKGTIVVEGAKVAASELPSNLPSVLSTLANVEKKVSYYFTYIEVPVLASFELPLPFAPRAFAGLSAGYLIDENAAFDVDKTDLSGRLGVSVKPLPFIHVVLEHQRGLQGPINETKSTVNSIGVKFEI
ncbi:MAG: hypothetical protein VW378_02610 [bacterium]